MARRWLLFGCGGAMILAGSTLAHLVQTRGDVTVRAVRFPADSGLMMSGALYAPRTATAEHPAPAVLVSHGYINTREMQSAFAIELSRRGFVVLAMDMTGHGSSQGRVGTQDFGGPAALAFLRSLREVDTLNIGMEGHSLGGAPILAAAAAMPNGYRSMVLVGSTTGVFGRAGAGTPTFPRNLAVIFGQFDEFAMVMWQVRKGADVGSSDRLRTLFGSADAVVADRRYGAAESGTARVLHLPPVTHPAEHFSRIAIAQTVSWFQHTLDGATTRDPMQQIWIWKEIGTLVAFAGFVLLLLGAFTLLLTLPLFASLNVEAVPLRSARTGRWWLTFSLTAAVPALTFYPFMKMGAFIRPTALFPQSVMNQLVVWALLNGALTLVIEGVLRRGRQRFRPVWGKSLLIAVATVAIGYLSLALSDVLFGVDFRFWVLGLRPLDGAHVRIALAYLPFWTLFFLVAMRALLSSTAIQGDPPARSYATAALAMCSGFVLLLALQYASLFATGLLLTPGEPLNTVVAIQFVPLLAIVGLIGAFTYRRTNAFAPGAFICAMFITWYIVAGTAIHV